MTAYSEETKKIGFGNGLYTADLASSIPEGYCAECTNGVPTGTSIENRLGLRRSNVIFNEQPAAFDRLNINGFTYLGASVSDANPAIIWRSGDSSTTNSKIHMIRDGNPFTDPGSVVSDGYAEFLNDSPASNHMFIGAVNYNDRIYLFDSTRVRKINTLTWGVTPSMSTTVIPSTPSTMRCQPIHFFDRLWVSSGNTLYYTDAVTSPGAYPETWNISTNFIKVVGRSGPGVIYKLIPLGSRIFIFTSAGLFGLTVIGNPSDWYLRPLDEKAIVNSYECAFETDGIIYYSSIYGVFATTGTDKVKLSGPIENLFLAGNFEAGPSIPSKQSYVYRLNYLDGGMILSCSNYFFVAGSPYHDAYQSHNLYTRLSNISWSQWKLPANKNEQLLGILGTADAVETYINKEPLSYVMTMHTDSAAANPQPTVKELLVYDGLEDNWTNRVGLSPATETAPIDVSFTSRVDDAGSPVDIKQFKYAYIHMYTSDKTMLNDPTKWIYKWVTNSEEFSGADVIPDISDDEITSLEFNMIKIEGGFTFRSMQFHIELSTENDVSFKIKDVYMKVHGLRDGPLSAQ